MHVGHGYVNNVCLHSEACGFITFSYVTVATHVTACDLCVTRWPNCTIIWHSYKSANQLQRKAFPFKGICWGNTVIFNCMMTFHQECISYLEGKQWVWSEKCLPDFVYKRFSHLQRLHSMFVQLCTSLHCSSTLSKMFGVAKVLFTRSIDGDISCFMERYFLSHKHATKNAKLGLHVDAKLSSSRCHLKAKSIEYEGKKSTGIEATFFI